MKRKPRRTTTRFDSSTKTSRVSERRVASPTTATPRFAPSRARPVARDVEEEDYFPRIKYDASLERDDDDDDGDDEIIRRYLAKYGDDLLGAASSV